MLKVARSLLVAFLFWILPSETRRLLIFLRRAQWRVEKLERNVQRLAAATANHQFGNLLSEKPHKSIINRHEFSVHSQNGEDGILLYIFSQLGIANRCFVEFGIGDGRECNSANLSFTFGWHGLLMDSDARNVESARHYFDVALGDRKQDVKILHKIVTAENINTILTDHQIDQELDLFCIDIDGNDYWIWEALEVVRPRVMVVEYNPAYGPERSLTIPYQKGAFNRYAHHYSGFYFGASLTALTKLAHQKDYQLVGCDSTGTNAFFVRQDILADELAALLPPQAYYPSVRYHASMYQDGIQNPPEPFVYIQSFDFVQIE
jgi:hypothetical protein